MAFINTPDAGPDADNIDRAFAARPDIYGAWRGLVTPISENMDLRTYELATLAAARRLRSSYCSLAHGTVLAKKVFDWGTVRDIASGDVAALTARDVAVMRFAEQGRRRRDLDHAGGRRPSTRGRALRRGDLRRRRGGGGALLLQQAARRRRRAARRELLGARPRDPRRRRRRPADRVGIDRPRLAVAPAEPVSIIGPTVPRLEEGNPWPPALRSNVGRLSAGSS